MVTAEEARRLAAAGRGDTGPAAGPVLESGSHFAVVVKPEVMTGRHAAEALATAVGVLHTDGARVPVGISIGIGTAAGGEPPDAVYERLVRAADDDMYADKARRRPRSRR